MRIIRAILDSHLWFYFMGSIAGFALGSAYVMRKWRNHLLLEHEWVKRLSTEPLMLVEAKIRAMRKEQIH